MTGIIDVGGGLRGAYGAGVFEYCLDENLKFDKCIGISAGAANIVTYLAGQKDRLIRFYCTYPFRKEYMSIRNMLKTGEYLSLHYIYDVLSVPGGEDTFDYDEAIKSDDKCELAVTDAVTGEQKFMRISDMQPDNLWVLKASCCIPIICRPIKQNGDVFYDGGISVPIPYEHALKQGCDKLVIILTRPTNYRKQPGADIKAAKLLKKKYPETSELLQKRADNYNQGVEMALQLEKEGKALVIAPDDTCGVDTLSKSADNIEVLFRKGYKDAEAIKKFMNQ